MAFRACLRRHHLPRKKDRDGSCFEPVRAPATSLTCNSETEVDFYVISTPFTPPLPRMQE